MKKANECIQRDITVETAIEYLRTASENNDEEVEESARMLIVENYNGVEGDKLVSLPVEMFRSIVCSDDLQTQFLSDVCCDINLFFETNPEELNAQILDEMTSHLPVSAITPSTATSFRKLICQLDPKKEDEESWLALTTLCKMCAHSLAHNWKELDIERTIEEFSSPRIEGDFRGGGRLSVLLLGESLRQAKIKYEQERTQLQQSKRFSV